MSQRLFVLALVALSGVAAAAAQARPGAEPKRGAYVVKHAAAKDLAAILSKHFKGTAEIQTGPAGTSNCLLVNAPPAVFDEVMKLVDKLDRRPQLVAVEILVVELPVKKADEKGLSEKDLSGGIDDVVERLFGMQRKEQVVGFKRMRLTTLEGQVASLMVNESKPLALGGGAISYRNFGTRIKVTPEVAADRSVTLDLNVQDGRVRDSDTVPGTPELINTSLAGKVRVASGKAALAKDTKVISKEGKGEMLIVVGARVIEPGAEGK
jgi:type II secretory pathway component GspD/PulD (secretin)